MAQRFSIGLFSGAVYRPLDGRLVSAAFAVGIAVISLLAAAAAPPLVSSWSTIVGSTRLQPSAAAVTAENLIRDRASRTNDDDYLEGLVKALNDER